MGTNQRTLSEVVALAAKMLSGWKVPTLKNAKTLARYLLTQSPDRKKGE
jgi:hypothetical protein